jgi:hypothetical protein
MENTAMEIDDAPNFAPIDAQKLKKNVNKKINKFEF